MNASRTRFAWIIHEASGFKVLAASDLLCDLLGLPRDAVVGGCVIGEPIVSRLRDATANFAEATLIEGMIVHSARQRLGLTTDSEAAHRIQWFLDWARDYIATYIQAHPDCLASAALPGGQRQVELMKRCYTAMCSASDADWPAFVPTSLDYMGLDFAKHELLPEGAIAHFIKSGVPIPSHDPVAFMVLLQPRHGDDVAHQLEKDILARRAERWRASAP